MAYNNLDFVGDEYVPGIPYDLEFYHGISYHILKGSSNYFSAVWMANGRFMVSSLAALSIIDIDTNGVIDWYTTTFSGRAEEALTNTDIKDIVGD